MILGQHQSVYQPAFGHVPSLPRDVSALYAFNAGGGDQIFDVTENKLNGTLTNSPAWGAQGGAWGVECTSTAHVLLPDAFSTAIQDGGTICFLWWHDGTTTSGHMFDNRQSNNNGWDIDIDTGNNMRCLIDTGGSVTTTVAAPTTIGFHTWSCGWDGTNVLCILDGHLEATNTITGTASQSSSPKLFNQVNNADPFGAGRFLQQVIVFDRSVPKARIVDWHLDPWQFWNRTRLPLNEVAAGGLSIPVAMHSYRRRRVA